MKFFALYSLYIFSFLASAMEPVVVKEPVSFSDFWYQTDQLKIKYTCSFNKEQNPYFEFLFTVLGIESSDAEEIKNTSILSKSSIKLIDEKLLSKSKEDNSYAQVLCVTNEKAIVLRKSNSIIKPDGYSFSVAWVSQYDFEVKNGAIKLQIPDSTSDLWYRMNTVIDSYVFYKVKYEQAIPKE